MIPIWMIEGDESEAFDRKREWPSNKITLLHDILCLCNSFVDSDRFLAFGIDNTGILVGVEQDPNRHTNADLQDFLRAQKLNRVPTIRLRSYEHEGHVVDLLEIRNRPDKPFFLREDRSHRGELARAGAIYTRIGDTNVPLNGSAPEEMVELMWRERFGIGKPPLLRFHQLLHETEAWLQPDELTPIYHKDFPEFTITSGETLVEEFAKEWSKRFPDPQAKSYCVAAHYFGTVLERYLFVSCDGGRYQVPSPERDGKGRYWIEVDSPVWRVASLLNTRSKLRLSGLERCGIELVHAGGYDRPASEIHPLPSGE